MTDTTSCVSNAPESLALSATEARDRMVAEVVPISGREFLPVRSALGRILATDIIAPHDVPAHDNSAMDGYAVRYDSLATADETKLTVVGTAFAGSAFSGLVGKGQAVRIMTGAVLPAGADTVVVQEVTRVEADTVFVPAGQRQGQNTRRAGEDLAHGAVALPAGKRIGPAELGLIASLGVAEVEVKRRLRVAFFSTGDELASIGKPLAPGEIYDSTATRCMACSLGSVPISSIWVSYRTSRKCSKRPSPKRRRLPMPSSPPVACRSARPILFARSWKSWARSGSGN
jgi:molybdopterin molybdotransferase